jgi:hypothetical protein
MFVASVVCLSGRGLCDGLITRPEFYRLWCVLVCGVETWTIRWPLPGVGCCAREKNTDIQQDGTHKNTCMIYYCVSCVDHCMAILCYEGKIEEDIQSNE